MTDPFAASLPVFAKVFGETVRYAGAGLPAEADVTVIWSDVPGDPFQGAGNTTRKISMEISKGLLPERPSTADRISRRGGTWRPNEVIDDEEFGSWVVVLESVG